MYREHHHRFLYTELATRIKDQASQDAGTSRTEKEPLKEVCWKQFSAADLGSAARESFKMQLTAKESPTKLTGGKPRPDERESFTSHSI